MVPKIWTLYNFGKWKQNISAQIRVIDLSKADALPERVCDGKFEDVEQCYMSTNYVPYVEDFSLELSGAYKTSEPLRDRSRETGVSSNCFIT